MRWWRPRRAGEAERLIEPYTSYNVARVQKDLFGGSSNIGGLGTAVMREGDVDAYTGSVDYSLRWSSNKYTWNGQWGGTRSAVSGVMTNGFGGVTNFNYNSKHVNLFSHYDYFSSGFKNSDLGFFFGRNNKQQINGGINLGNPDPGRVFRRINLNSSVFTQFNNDRLEARRELLPGCRWAVPELLELLHRRRPRAPGLRRSRHPRRSADRQARRVVHRFVRVDRLAQAHPPQRRCALERQPRGRTLEQLQRQPELPAVAAGAGPHQHRHHRRRSTSRSGSATRTSPATASIDHVYGTLDRNVVNVTARTTYAFTRDMTLEVYLQPFVAVGDYGNIRRLARAKSYEFEPVVIDDNPDFSTKSLRSNVVFRWEYRRGSTLYLVYNVVQQRRLASRRSSRPSAICGAASAPPGRRC